MECVKTGGVKRLLDHSSGDSPLQLAQERSEKVVLANTVTGDRKMKIEVESARSVVVALAVR